MAGKRKRSWKRIVLWVIGILVIILAVVQAIPYGRTGHSNPPATNAFTWTDPQAEALAKASCYDCHSNATDWWWATNIAPFSWLVQADVDGGRSRLNFSEYQGQPSLEEFQDVVQGGMPPFQYTIIHPSAKLSDAEKQTLIKGYTDSIAANGR
jgi:cytochrome c551/c552